MRRELLRLQKTSFLNDLASSALLWKAKAFVVANIAYYAMSSSRGGIYYKCFLKIVTKFGGGSYPIVLQ